MKTARELIESVVNGYQSPSDIFRDLVYRGRQGDDDSETLNEHSGHSRLLMEATGGDIALPKMPTVSSTDQLMNRMGGKLPDDDEEYEQDNFFEITIDDPEDENEYEELFTALDAAGIEYDTTFGDDDDSIVIRWPEKEKEKIDKVFAGLGYEVEAVEPDSAPDDTDYNEP